MTTQPIEDAMNAALAPPSIPITDFDDGTAAVALDDWHPLDVDTASWAARSLARRQQRLAEIRTIIDDQRFRLATFEAEQTAKLTDDIAFFEGRLKAFHEYALGTDPKALTIRLPDGTELRSQSGKVSVEVTDIEAFTMWAEIHEVAQDVMLDPPPPAPDKREIAKRFAAKAAAEKDPGTYPAVTEKGEAVPGVQFVRGGRTFTIAGPQ